MSDFNVEKPFSALSEAEKASVLAEMPAEEYDALHHALHVFAQMDADAAPPPQLRAQLLAHPRLQGLPPQVSLGWKMPLAMAAAFAAGMGVMAFLPKKQAVPAIEKPVQQVVIQRDTIILRDTIFQTRWRVRYLPPTDTATVSLFPIAKQEAEPKHLDLNAPTSNAGKPLSDTPALMEFLGMKGERRQ